MIPQTLVLHKRKKIMGKTKVKVIYCPVNGWDCPYFDANGCCMMYPNTDPIDECDDFSTFWEKGDDYVVTIED